MLRLVGSRPWRFAGAGLRSRESGNAEGKPVPGVARASAAGFPAYVTVAITRKRLRIEESLHAILQIPSLTIFEKTPLNQLLDTTVRHIQPDGPGKQLNLFNY